MWTIKYSYEAQKDMLKLDKMLQQQVLKGIYKVSQNPLPAPDGYGKPPWQ